MIENLINKFTNNKTYCIFPGTKLIPIFLSLTENLILQQKLCKNYTFLKTSIIFSVS